MVGSEVRRLGGLVNEVLVLEVLVLEVYVCPVVDNVSFQVQELMH